MAPNSPAWSFSQASMAGSRSTAPLNRSKSDFIIAPVFVSRPVLLGAGVAQFTRGGHRQGEKQIPRRVAPRNDKPQKKAPRQDTRLKPALRHASAALHGALRRRAG